MKYSKDYIRMQKLAGLIIESESEDEETEEPEDEEEEETKIDAEEKEQKIMKKEFNLL